MPCNHESENGQIELTTLGLILTVFTEAQVFCIIYIWYDRRYVFLLLTSVFLKSKQQ